MRAAVKSELGSAFRPEFLNRLDEVIVFESLQPSEVEQVAGLMLKEVAKQCEEEDFSLTWTPAVAKFVSDSGFSSKYGARPLRRAVQRSCEDAIAEAVLEGFVVEGDALELDIDKNGDLLLICNGKTRSFSPPEILGIEEDEPYVDTTTVGNVQGVGDLAGLRSANDSDRPRSLSR